MKYYLCQSADGPQLAPTQAEAKALDPKFVEHHVPDDKDGRMAYVNDLLRQLHQAKAARSETFEKGFDAGAQRVINSRPDETPALPQVEQPTPKFDEGEAKRRMVTMLQAMRTDEIEAKILEARGPAFGRFLSAAICRLGELGREGFREFLALRSSGGDAEAEVGRGKGKRFHLTASDERGLRYLALCQLDGLIEETASAEASN